MRLAFPIFGDHGLQSETSPGLEDAQQVLVVDPERTRAEPLALPGPAPDRAFRLVDALRAVRVDAVVVDTVGEDLLRILCAHEITVYRSPFSTVADALDALAAGALRVVPPPAGCACHDPFRRGCGSCGG
jgi:predicted Fe-Mo cluster-binding NifX family protein